jgi:hypothetical protein
MATEDMSWLTLWWKKIEDALAAGFSGLRFRGTVSVQNGNKDRLSTVGAAARRYQP